LGDEQSLRKAGAVCEDVGRHLIDVFKKNKMACNVFSRNNNYCVMRLTSLYYLTLKTLGFL
jgi:hypothetical protein